MLCFTILGTIRHLTIGYYHRQMKTNIEQFIFVTYQTGVWVLELCFIYIKWTPKIIIIYLYLGVR